MSNPYVLRTREYDRDRSPQQGDMVVSKPGWKDKDRRTDRWGGADISLVLNRESMRWFCGTVGRLVLEDPGVFTVSVASSDALSQLSKPNARALPIIARVSDMLLVEVQLEPGFEVTPIPPEE